MIGNNRISWRVYWGFGLVVLILSFLAIYAYRGIDEVSDQFSSFSIQSMDTIEGVELNAEAIELQRNIQLYTFTGYDGAASRAHEISERLFEKLANMRSKEKDEEALVWLDRLDIHLEGYMTNFDTVIEERQIRSELVEGRMKTIRKEVENRFRELVAYDELPYKSELLGTLSYFLDAADATSQFFQNPDSSLVRQTKEFLELSSEGIVELEAMMGEGELFDQVLEIDALMGEYSRAFLRAVQATRAYLYLVNVVMAGEAAEFAYVSERIRERDVDKLASIQRISAAKAIESQAVTRRLLVLAILFAVLCSWLIAKSIVSPLDAITKIFNRLAKGERDLVIPGIERKDEIGEMAQAASIFQEMNSQTEILLEESRKLTSEINDKSKALERSNREMEQFVYTVSHDLKSPLVTSQGFIGMMRDLASKGEYERAFSKMDRLDKANRRMNDLISDLLNLSRVGRVELERETIDMNELLNSVYEGLEPKFVDRGFRFERKQPLPALWANSVRAVQLFDNIINNALKYGRSEVDSVVEVGAIESGQYVDYYVKDHGKGIPKDYHDKIFGLFQRLDSSKDGTGIGLSIVAKIMESHHGKVWLESDVGKGATFWMRFPKKNF